MDSLAPNFCNQQTVISIIVRSSEDWTSRTLECYLPSLKI